MQRTADLDELAFMQWLKNEGHYTDLRPLPNGRWAGLLRFMYTHAIIVGRIGDRDSYDNRWCYENETIARAGLEAWNGEGEPQGWHRHPLTGRRRPGGDTTAEYVNP